MASKIVDIIQSLLGIEEKSNEVDVKTDKVGKKRHNILKKSLGIGARLAGVAGLGLVVLPMVMNKIFNMLGIGKEEEGTVDISEVEAELEKEEKSFSITDAVKGLLGGPKEEAIPPSISTPISKKIDLSSVDLTQPSEQVMSYIDEAAKISGVDKGLLLAVAHQESRFKEGAVSSIGAKGVFQVTPKTWNYLVSKYGKKYGIKPGDRNNSRANTIIGAIYIKQIIDNLAKSLGHKPSVTDIYAGYFLGPRGVKTLLKAIAKTPDMKAAKLLPQAAKHNKNIFYHPDGKAKTVSEVYITLYGKVGLQYLKFSQQENLTPQYGITTSFEYAQQAIPVKVGLGKAQNTEVEPMRVRLEGRTNTNPVKIDLDFPQKQVRVQEEGTKLEQEVKNQLAYSVRTKNNPEHNFIRDRAGRLLTIEVN